MNSRQNVSRALAASPGGAAPRALNAKNLLRFGIWNVRTLNAPGRSELLVDELLCHNIDICVLSEVRWTDSGETKICSSDLSQQYSLLYSGGTSCHRGVGFAIKQVFASSVVSFTPVSDRIAVIEISGLRNLSVVGVYAPTEVATAVDKDAFYADLQTVMLSIPKNNMCVIAGDMNAETGSDGSPWPGVLGPFGVGSLNDNGTRMLSFATSNRFVVCNTFFGHKRRHRETFISNDHKTVKRLDYLLVNRSYKSSVEDVKVNFAADVLSDHKLVLCKLRLHLKVQRSKRPKPRLDLDHLRDSTILNQYNVSTANRFANLPCENDLDVDERWENVKSCIVDAASEVLPKKRPKRHPWISDTTLQLRDQKLKASGRERNFLRRQMDRSLRQDEENWWAEKADEMEKAAFSGNSRALFQLVRFASGIQQRPAPIRVNDQYGKPIRNLKDQMNRWRGHFRDLLNRPDPPALDRDLDAVDIQIDPEIDVSAPSIAEVKAAIGALKRNKAAGPCEVSPELLKSLDESGVSQLHSLLLQVWEARRVPKDFKDSVIVPVFKKGSKSDCSNYRGISLLSIAGKVLTKIIRSRLNIRYEASIREQQAGFRSGRGCADQIFALRQCFERRLRHGRPTVAVFIDFACAFDSVHRISMWKVLRKCGIPPIFVEILCDMYNDAQSVVRVGQHVSEPFTISTGVRQGCIMSPMLFNLVLDWIMSKSILETDGIAATLSLLLADLEYADDIVVLAESERAAQIILDRISDNALMLGLRVKPSKSKVMSFHTPTPNLTVDGEVLENVNTFTYLGSTLSNDKVSPSDDIACRIAKASRAFGSLTKRLWRRTDISIRTKMKVFNAAIIPILVYGSESWCPLKSDIDRLEVFHMQCLRTVYGCSLLDRISNKAVRQHCLDQPPVETIVMRNRIRWLGHVARMNDSRICKRIWLEPNPVGWRCTTNAPKKTWDKLVLADLHPKLRPAYGAHWIKNPHQIICGIAEDRLQWRREFVRGIPTALR